MEQSSVLYSPVCLLFFRERMEMLKRNESSTLAPLAQNPNFLQVDPTPLIHIKSPPRSKLHSNIPHPNTPEYVPRRSSIDF